MEPMAPGIIATLLDSIYLLVRILYLFNNISKMVVELSPVMEGAFDACITLGVLLFVLCCPYKKNLSNILDSLFVLLQ